MYIIIYYLNLSRHFYRKTGDGRDQCQRSVRPPHPVKTVGILNGEAAKIGAQKRTHLMWEHGQTKQRADIAQTKQPANQSGGGWDGRQPGRAQYSGENVPRHLCFWGEHIAHHRQHAYQI